MRILLLSSLMVVAVACWSPVPEGTDAGSGGGVGGGAGGGIGGGGGSDAGTDGGMDCTPACGSSRTCCQGTCVNTANDPANCGACGVTCTGTTPYCGGTCTAAPCLGDGGSCTGAESCCGAQCCTAGQLCCDTQGPVSGLPECFTPTSGQPTCPQGCAPLCSSDRNIKKDFRGVNERQVLQRLATLPISTWTYKDDAAGTRHIGPMAQDLKATFEVGDTDTAYHPVDAHGISFAAIKALYQLAQEQDARLLRLEQENRQLRAGACGKADGPTEGAAGR